MTKNNYKDLIYKLYESPLGSIPFHQDTEFIQRIAPKGFPFHMAVHRIINAKGLPNKYVKSHKHDHPEINIILGDNDNLEYSIRLGNEDYVVNSPSAIWIPAGLEHSANVIKGSGQYICIILSNDYNASKG